MKSFFFYANVPHFKFYTKKHGFHSRISQNVAISMKTENICIKGLHMQI